MVVQGCGIVDVMSIAGRTITEIALTVNGENARDDGMTYRAH